jgi:hypothetical protein
LPVEVEIDARFPSFNFFSPPLAPSIGIWFLMGPMPVTDLHLEYATAHPVWLRHRDVLPVVRSVASFAA